MGRNRHFGPEYQESLYRDHVAPITMHKKLIDKEDLLARLKTLEQTP